MNTRTTVAERIASAADDWNALERAESEIEDGTSRPARKRFRQAVREQGPLGPVVAALDEGLGTAVDTLVAHKRRFLELYDEVAKLRDTIQMRTGPSGSPLPVMVYRGVWRDGDSYVPGDCVTHASTIWHAGLFTKSRPGMNGDWQMMAKGGASERKSQRAMR